MNRRSLQMGLLALAALLGLVAILLVFAAVAALLLLALVLAAGAGLASRSRKALADRRVSRAPGG